MVIGAEREHARLRFINYVMTFATWLEAIGELALAGFGH